VKQANAADAENARLDEEAKQEAAVEAEGTKRDNEEAGGSRRSLRWWHDPEKAQSSVPPRITVERNERSQPSTERSPKAKCFCLRGQRLSWTYFC
jgi:hypothetical protein